MEPGQLRLHLNPQVRIERAERLIQKEDARLCHQGAGERHALLLTAGKLVDVPPRQFADPEPFEPVHGRPAPRRLVHLAHPEPELDVLEDRHEGEECEGLPDQRRVPPPGLQLVHAHAVQPNLPGAGPVETGDHAQGRRLAASARPHEGDELAGLDFHAYVAHGLHRAEALADVVQDEKCIGHRVRLPCGRRTSSTNCATSTSEMLITKTTLPTALICGVT